MSPSVHPPNIDSRLATIGMGIVQMLKREMGQKISATRRNAREKKKFPPTRKVAWDIHRPGARALSVVVAKGGTWDCIVCSYGVIAND